MVFLKIRPYWQVSLRRKRNENLSPKVFGPYKIVERIGPVAYKLELPNSAVIHLVCHVSQLKKMFGQHTENQQEFLYVTENHEWRVVLDEVYGYLKNKAGGWDALVS